MNVFGVNLLLYFVKIIFDDMNVNCSLWNFCYFCIKMQLRKVVFWYFLYQIINFIFQFVVSLLILVNKFFLFLNSFEIDLYFCLMYYFYVMVYLKNFRMVD